MVAYADSSVILRHVLLGEISIEHALEFPRVVTSELAEIECKRVIHRYSLQGNLSDETLVEATERLDRVLSGIDLLELGRSVKERAMQSFPVAIKTLDAFHVATAVLLHREEDAVVLFSHDTQMNRCARAMGLAAPFSG